MCNLHEFFLIESTGQQLFIEYQLYPWYVSLEAIRYNIYHHLLNTYSRHCTGNYLLYAGMGGLECQAKKSRTDLVGSW